MGCVIDDEQHFQINPTLAPVVLNIFNDYLSGKTQKEIRDELNNKGLKNANGREFTINNISKIFETIESIFCKERKKNLLWILSIV